jgi:ribosomal protein S20
LRSSASEKASKDVLSTNQSKVDKNLDSAARKGLIHWKKAARLKSRLAKMVNSVVK